MLALIAVHKNVGEATWTGGKDRITLYEYELFQQLRRDVAVPSFARTI